MGSNFTPWRFSLNNSETVDTVTLAFCAAFSNVSVETFVPYLVSLTCSNLQILGKTETGISDFLISGQSLIKENSHNSRTSDDIDMKLEPVTKLDKRNKTTSKKFDDDIKSAKCDVIIIFLIYGQFGAIWKLDSGCIVCKTYIFIKNNLCLTKTEKITKKSQTQLSHYCFE